MAERPEGRFRDGNYLGVQLNDSAELAPRQRLVSSAFALHAGIAEHADVATSADSFGGQPAASYVTKVALPDLCLAPGDLAAALTDAGYVTADDLAAYLEESGYIATWTPDALMEALSEAGYLPADELAT